MPKILSQHDIPQAVQDNARVNVHWDAFSLSELSRLSRYGYQLKTIAAQLPALWFFRPELAGELLEQAIGVDSLVQKSCHKNLATGIFSDLAEGESDAVYTAEEISSFSPVFTNLCQKLLSLSKADYERVLGVILDSMLTVETSQPISAPKPTRATVATSDRPKRQSGGGQNRTSEAEVDRRILQLCRSLKGESLAQIAKIVSPLQNRAKESNQTLKECTLQRVEGLAALGLGEVLGEGRNTRFRSFAIAAPQPSTAGLQLSRRLCSVA